jgi:hypothetical protein
MCNVKIAPTCSEAAKFCRIHTVDKMALACIWSRLGTHKSSIRVQRLKNTSKGAARHDNNLAHRVRAIVLTQKYVICGTVTMLLEESSLCPIPGFSRNKIHTMSIPLYWNKANDGQNTTD